MIEVFIKAIFGLILTGILLVFIFFITSKQIFGDRYGLEEMIENYERREIKIAEVREYLDSIVPENTKVDIEFGKSKHINIFHYHLEGSLFRNEVSRENWDLEYDSDETINLLEKLNWTIIDLKTLRSKLDEANCISVNNGQPYRIGFQRDFMAKYYYLLYDQKLSKEQQIESTDNCTLLFYKDHIVFSYESGTIGSMCTNEFKSTNNY